MKPLFIDGITAEDSTYNNLRDSENPHFIMGKELTEKLWRIYQPHADKHFYGEIQKDFGARFWEMYLTCTLLEQGLRLSCPKPGPDVLVDLEGHRVWIEATAPTAGEPGLENTVPETQLGEVQDQPKDQIILRYRNAIDAKFNKAYTGYIKKKIISATDSYVVAINGCRIPSARGSGYIPEIVCSVFPVGDMEVSINRETLEWGEPRFGYRDGIQKGEREKISTSIFLDREYKNLSAILFSTVDAVNFPEKMGKDFIVIYNPLAKNPIPEGFLKIGREYHCKVNEEDFKLSHKDWS